MYSMHHGGLFRLLRRYPHPAPDKRACRSSGGVCEPEHLRVREFHLRWIFARPAACERAPRRLWRRMRTRIQSAMRFGRGDERMGHQRMKKAPHSRCFILWWPIRESNPSFQRERLASWPLDQWAIALRLNSISQRKLNCNPFFYILVPFCVFSFFCSKTGAFWGLFFVKIDKNIRVKS